MKNLIILTILVSLLYLPALANDRPKYGPEYFGPIEGEVSGQVLPGAEKVLVEGKSIPISKNNTFKTKVTLKEGQKYLTIETKYSGLRFLRKYLVIRRPGLKKPFKVHLAKSDFKSLVSKKRVLGLTKTAAKLAKEKKVQLVVQKKEKWAGFELVAEIEPGQLLVVEKSGYKYFGYMYVVKDIVWVPIQEISYWQFRALLEKGIVPEAFMRQLSQYASGESN